MNPVRWVRRLREHWANRCERKGHKLGMVQVCRRCGWWPWQAELL